MAKDSPARTEPRFTFPKISAEMKRYAALLEAELKRWPNVRTGKMFGMVSVYRGDRIFALLPATRSLEGANSIMIKVERRGSQGRPEEREGKKWDAVEILTEADLTAALDRLQQAYARAK